MLKVKINGNFKEIENNISAFDLLNLKNLKIETIVFIANEQVIKKKQLKNYIIKQNDEIEILRFVSGG